MLRLIKTVQCFFDQGKPLTLHKDLRAQREEVLSLIEEGKFPRVRVVFLGNGQRWNEEGQTHIDNARLDSTQIIWFSHEDIYKANKNVDDISGQFGLKGRQPLKTLTSKESLLAEFLWEK